MRLKLSLFAVAVVSMMILATSNVLSAEEPTVGLSGTGPTVRVGSFTADVGDQGVVDLELQNIGPPGVGDWVLDIQYDQSIVSVVECEATPGSFCNATFQEGVIRTIGVSVSGLEGDNTLASVTMRCEVGGFSSLTVVVDGLNDATKGAPQPVNTSVQNGSISCLGDPVPTVTSTEVPTVIDTLLPTDTPAPEPSATDLPGEPTEIEEKVETPLPIATLTPTAPPTKTPTTVPPTATPTSTSTLSLLLGDTDCDGRISSLDALLILQFAAALISSLPCPENADISGDGKIDPLDSALILQTAAGLI